MEEVLKSYVLHNLEEEWPDFIRQYNSFSEEEKGKYLVKQGYKSFSDLLSHIIAWWEEAIIHIKAIINNPEIKSPEYDVDNFNAEALRKNKGKEEKEIIKLFNEKRNELLSLISTLSDTQIKNKEMQIYLYWTITNHYKDHKI